MVVSPELAAESHDLVFGIAAPDGRKRMVVEIDVAPKVENFPGGFDLSGR